MDLTLNADQRAMQAALRDVLRGLWTPDRLRAAAETPALDIESWTALADVGLFGLLVPERDGGMGLGVADAVILLEEVGRSLAPGPIVPTMLAGGLVPSAAVVTTVDTGDPVAVAEHLESATHLVVVDDDGLFLSAVECAATSLTPPVDPLTPVSLVTLPDERGERI
jgi:hypothetical protein